MTESAASIEIPEVAESPAANDFFQKNLAAIRQWAPYLYSRLAAIEVPNTISALGTS